MTINGWDIAEAGARQWNVTFDSCDIENNSEWIEGSVIPLLFRNHTSFKELNITLMLKGNSREELLQARSDILANLLEPAVIKLDNYSHSFLGIMQKISSPNEEAMQRFHTLKFTFDCAEFGDMQTYTLEDTTNCILENPGNITGPLICEITALEDIDDYELHGICRKLSIMGRSIEEERNETETEKILADKEQDILGTKEVSGGDIIHYMLQDSDEKLIEDGSDFIIEAMDSSEKEVTPILSSTTTWSNDYAITMNLKAGDTITLNGETGVFTNASGHIPDDLTIWELPTVLPGSNIVHQNTPNVKIEFRWYPRYM